MKILYISDCNIENSAFFSQVYLLCRYLAKSKKISNVKIISLTPIKSYINSKHIIPYTPENNLEIIRIPKVPKAWIKPVSHIYTLLTLPKSYKYFKNCELIHARGHLGSLVALKSLNILKIKKPVICDIRGLVEEEFKLTYDGSPLLSYYIKNIRYIEKYIFTNGTYFLFLTELMKSYFLEKFPVLKSKKTFVMPPVVDTNIFFKAPKYRREIRKKLKIDEKKIVYIYVGTLSKWRETDKMMAIFSKMSHDPSNYFIILTQHIEKAKFLLKKYKANLESFFIETVPYSEVPRYLNAADFGILALSNSKASTYNYPLKAAEYAACGLKIISTLEDLELLWRQRTLKNFSEYNIYTIEEFTDKMINIYQYAKS